MFASNSPELIAANYVLHRLLVPRHSLYTLKNLTRFLYIQFSKSNFLGGGNRDRTGDLLVANQTLSQAELYPQTV